MYVHPYDPLAPPIKGIFFLCVKRLKDWGHADRSVLMSKPMFAY